LSDRWQQISLFDQDSWLNDGAYALSVSAEDVAIRIGWLHEQSFDDFDYFQCVVAQLGSKKIAIESRPRAPKPGSSVYLHGGADLSDLFDLLSSCKGLSPVRVYSLDGEQLS
jgi:hypothetical protein